MKYLRHLCVLILVTPLASCGQGDSGSSAVTRPREGGVEIDPPADGFQAIAGQTIYVPAYSSIFILNHSQLFDLAITLSIRNADRDHPIILTSVRYFDHNGNPIQDYLKKPLRVGPMASAEFFVREKDRTGGVSASFLVDWLSEKPVASPVVESVMIGTAGTQGISFTSSGRVLVERNPHPNDGGAANQRPRSQGKPDL